ncbi:MAG: ABC transporter permease [Chloroflexi bacterium]|nr:ABC transporter permease [Chloroflexota bacterium]
MSAQPIAAAGFGPKLRRWSYAGTIGFAKRKPIGAVAAVLLIALILATALAPWVSPFPPLKTLVGPSFDGPSWSHLFGTDGTGRDVLSRVLHGGRVSLTIGILSVLLGTTLGALVGLVSGYFGGMVDSVLQRLIDTLMAFPSMILALAIVSILGPSNRNLVITIAVVILPLASRVVRGSVLSAKQNIYVDAARAIGSSDKRIMFVHILPNVFAPILVVMSIQIGQAILLEASLSFLGLGTPPPHPSWGGMLSQEGRNNIETAYWVGLFPGVFLSIAVLGFNLLGDALRDILDPKLRGRGR